MRIMKNFKLANNAKTKELLTSECIDFVELDNQYIQVNEEFSTDELFDMAFTFGKQTEKEFWTKPETFSLPEKYADLLQAAKDEYQKDTHIQFSSLKIGVAANGICEISFGATQAIHMFNLCKEYGKLCADKETV